ncbi:CPBP family intramembrane glutamic endopeptidase [Paenibacillus sp. M1]|uniref:CPBP family intramembrane glutamic endopeptidase n=1 Tax=Paenibacillus haidiansis TaxID=1574488 RepID=A0ABU7VPX2_9BACL
MMEGLILLVNALINAIFKLALLSVIPIIVYLAFHRKRQGLSEYLGIKKPPAGSYVNAIKLSSIAYVFSIIVIVFWFQQSNGLTMNPLKEAKDTGSVFILVASSVLFGLQAGISEEVFFRGFLGKLLIRRFGFTKGNVIQTIIFIAPHYFTFINTNTPLSVFVLLMLNAGLMGYVFGYITEKKSNGSILPAILVHTLIDIASGFIMLALAK